MRVAGAAAGCYCCFCDIFCFISLTSCCSDLTCLRIRLILFESGTLNMYYVGSVLSCRPLAGLGHPHTDRKHVTMSAGKNDQIITIRPSRQESTGDLTLNSSRKVLRTSSLTSWRVTRRSLVRKGRLSTKLAT